MIESISLEGVSRAVEGETHLANVSIRLEAGSFTVLVGRMRAGKTSLLRVLAGLDRPTTGTLRFGDRDVTGWDARRRNVAMVYQQFVNYPSFTVFENIASPLRLAGLGRSEIERRVRATAEALRIETLLGRLPAELSGGQQQRTAIARALAKDADLVLLDEPLANLDYKLREELRTELREIFARRRQVVVYATAEPVEALLYGGNVAVLDEGRVLQSGATLDVYRSPATVRVGQIFGDPEMNVVSAEVSPDSVVLSDGVVSFRPTAHLGALPPGRYRLGFRPHHVRLTRGAEADARIPAKVEIEEPRGSDTLLHASAQGLPPLAAQLRGTHRHPLGEALDLFVSPDRMLAFDLGGRLVAAPPSARAHGTD